MLRALQPALVLLALLAGTTEQEPQHRVELLFASDFYPHQIAAATGEVWYGLFPHGSSWEIATTKIHIEPITSGCIENGRRVTVDRSDHPLLLLRGLPRLRPGSITAASLAHVKLMPGEGRDSRMGGETFRLVATGGGPGPAVRNYELRLVSLKVGSSQPIVAYHARERMPDMAWPPEIIWIGDIDRDGQPDLFADLKMFETPGQWALFLSSAAGPGELVRKVAEFDGVDC
jgi:hypothetical protein